MVEVAKGGEHQGIYMKIENVLKLENKSRNVSLCISKLLSVLKMDAGSRLDRPDIYLVSANNSKRFQYVAPPTCDVLAERN